MVGPMARPGGCGLGPGLGLKYEIVLQAGPGLDIIVAGRAGSGPHNSICGPGPGQVSTTAAGPGRAANFLFPVLVLVSVALVDCDWLLTIADLRTLKS